MVINIFIVKKIPSAHVKSKILSLQTSVKMVGKLIRITLVNMMPLLVNVAIFVMDMNTQLFQMAILPMAQNVLTVTEQQNIKSKSILVMGSSIAEL